MTTASADSHGHPGVPELAGLTTLRFLAALLVMLYHFSGQLSIPPNSALGRVFGIGYVGVTFFFLLSGFILAYNYERVEFRAPGAVRKFLCARTARIYPLYLLAFALGLTQFLFAKTTSQLDPLVHKLGLSAAILEPLGIQAWVPGAAGAINTPSWSVSVECFFYCLFPFLLHRIIAAPKTWACLTIGFWIATNAFTIWLWDAFGTPGETIITFSSNDARIILLEKFIKFFPLLHLPEFAAGILGYVYWRSHRTTLSTRLLMVVAAINFSLLAGFADGIPAPLMNSGLSAIVWLPVIFAGAGATSTLLTARVPVFLGKSSYALYLFHLLLLGYLKAANNRLPFHPFSPPAVVAITFISSLVFAAVVHLLIEEPLRRRLFKGLYRSVPLGGHGTMRVQ